MKLWGGRFQKGPSEVFERFSNSLAFDRRLIDADVRGSIAFAGALERVGILTALERGQLAEAFEKILEDSRQPEFYAGATDEDVHTLVIRKLKEAVGGLADKIHTGRSRNEQVATDTRLYLLGKIGEVRALVKTLQGAIIDRAAAHLDVLMPGYTHLQPAQPILFSHWMLSFFWMLQRDVERLDDLTHRVAVLPLGSAALAGNTFGIDRGALAEALGFEAASENSLDAVSDRDFIAEFLFWAALLQTHLSRLAEDLILYATAEFGFVELDDAYSTGSSIMPQKKNPDALELARGKTGRMVGNLVGLLTALKGIPSAYDKDLQEDKEPLFDTLDTLELELPVMTGVIATLKVNAGRMARALGDELLATDLADALVRRGVPFRESHRLVGLAVRRALAQGCGLRGLSVEDYAAISPAFGDDVASVLDFAASVARHDVTGGTAPAAVADQLRRARERLRD